jgi:hypothetical protein
LYHVSPEITWAHLNRWRNITDEQSAEERFRIDRPTTAQFLDRAVLKGLPLQAALIATVRQYPNERDAEEAMGRERNEHAPTRPNARKRELIGKRVNELVEQAIYQLVPIVENRIEDSLMTGERPFDIVEDPSARAVGSKLAEDIFALFPWFDAAGSGGFKFYGLKKQPVYDIEDHPAWETFRQQSTLLRKAKISKVAGGFYYIVMDRYEDLQRAAVAAEPTG